MSNILNKKNNQMEYFDIDAVKDEFGNYEYPEVNTTKIIPGYQMENFNMKPYIKQHLCWTAAATKTLITLRGEREAEFETAGSRKMSIWNEITVQMHQLGYSFTVEKISKKWHNIMITYKKNLEKKLRTGNVYWEFFYDIDMYYKDKRVGGSLYEQNDDDDDEDDDDDDDADYDEDDITTIQQQSLQLPSSSSSSSSQSKLTITKLPQKRPSPPLVASSSPQLAIQNKSYNDLSSTQQSSLLDPLINNIQSGYKKIKTEPTTAQFDTNSNSINIDEDIDEFKNNGLDEIWLKEYLQHKLEMDRERMKQDEQCHREYIECQKAAYQLQDRVEKTKIAAINNLTKAINKLIETKQQRKENC